MYDLLLTGGTLVTPARTYRADIAAADGRIAAIFEPGRAPRQAGKAVDIDGLHVLPGAIDVHVHFREPGASEKETWTTGSRAAAAGGVTSVFDMPNTEPPTTDVERLEQKQAFAQGNSYVDFGLYGVATDSNIDHIGPLIEAGVIGFKIFQGGGPDEIAQPNPLNLLTMLRQAGAAGLRTVFHAQDRDVYYMTEDLVKRQGRRGLEAYVASRPPESEVTAIAEVIALGLLTGAPVHVAHFSSSQAVNMLRMADRQALNITAETYPHYLLLSMDDPAFRGMEGRARQSPPVRYDQDRDQLWVGLDEGLITVLSSDHAPHLNENKYTAVETALPGIAGVQFTLPLLLDLAVAGKITLQQVVRWTATAPAQAFGLHPRKGSLRVGADADLAIVDLNQEWSITPETIFSQDQTIPYLGRRGMGSVIHTIVRGQVVMSRGTFPNPPGGQRLRAGIGR